MVKKFNSFNSQLECGKHSESVVALTNEAKLSLYKKSQKSGFSTDILEEVYRRGYSTWNESFAGTPEQFAFDRVNSFIAGGFAVQLDEDLMDKRLDEISIEKVGQVNKARLEKPSKTPAAARTLSNAVKKAWLKSNVGKLKTEEVKEPTGDLKDACWKGYTAVGMKEKNGKKVPNCVPVKEQNDKQEKQSKDKNKSSSRFDATDSLVNIYANDTPGQEKIKEESHLSVIKRVIAEATYKGRKVSLNKPFRTPGGPKKSAVYVDPDGDGKAKIVRFGDPKLSIKKNQPARKRSYCARSSGQGNLTKKDSANYWSRRAWDC